MMKAALPVLALSLALAACAPAAKAPPASLTLAAAAVPAPTRPAPAAPLPAEPSIGWMDTPITQGAWQYRDFGAGMGKRAEFLDPPNGTYFSFDCVTYPNGPEILFTRFGRPTKPTLLMTIRTETAQRALTAQRFGAETIMVAVPASDSLLDAIALSKGRFAVEVEGEAPLYLPSWAEVSRVIEDCR
jgi:hypothetical protein